MDTMLHCFSYMNPWMDCLVLINRADKDRAIEIINKAFDEFWDDSIDSWECYGDQLEEALYETEILYAIQYGETTNEDDDSTSERYDDFVEALGSLFDNDHWFNVVI